MPHASHVLELAIFTVKPDCLTQVPALRAQLRETLKSFPGLIDYRAYCPMTDNRVFADLAEWDTLAHAQHVAKAFSDGDPRFANYMNAIESLTFMSHFIPEAECGEALLER